MDGIQGKKYGAKLQGRNERCLHGRGTWVGRGRNSANPFVRTK